MVQTAQEARQKSSERSSKFIRAQTLAVQDIGALPPVKNQARRDAADGSFRLFCESYFPLLFPLAWSDDHLKVIAKLEATVNHNETYAVAMPRGSGKTTLCLVAVLWAILTGKHPFVILIGSTADYAWVMIENLKAHLSGNDLLLEDYPEAIFPIRKLEGEARRAKGQRYYGVRTHIGWGAEEIVMPTIPGSRCSGAVVKVAGITGSIRGAMVVRSDGRSVRPTLAIIDDPQTDASAKSPSQVAERLSIISGAVAGLAGPGRRTARIVPCTVIRAGDLADQLLDRRLNPEWQGERTKLVYAFPTNEKLWQDYAIIRADHLRAGGNGSLATEFYREHQAAMDEGAIVAWKEWFNANEVSAIQHAMNLKLLNEDAFFAEYQNEPRPVDHGDGGLMTTQQISEKLSGIPRNHVPLPCQFLTSFIDVQQDVLFWLVAAWEQNFTGYVIDYGTYPEQKRRYFSLHDLTAKLSDASPSAGIEGAILAGLNSLIDQLCGRVWKRQDGADMQIDRLLVDKGYQPDTVYQVCRNHPQAARILPSGGQSIRAANLPFEDYSVRPGERMGHHWLIRSNSRRAMRHAMVDVNYWKSFVHARLAVSLGDPGSLSLFGSPPGGAAVHRLFADHLRAEYRTRTEGRGRIVDEWDIKPEKPDNHFFDALVSAAAAASMVGAELTSATGIAKPKQRERIKFSEQRQRALG